MKLETIKCTCGHSFQWENDESTFSHLTRPSLCDPCAEVAERKAIEEREARLADEQAQKVNAITGRALALLDEQTPTRYRDTDANHPGFNGELWKRISKWKPTPQAPWLGIVGTAGACKSRIAYRALRGLVIESIQLTGKHTSFIAMTSYEFSEQVRNLYSNLPSDDDPELTLADIARRTLDRAGKCGVLLLDDMGKARHTAAPAAELFALIDRRHCENLPMIWTSNGPPDEIVNGMSSDLAGPIAGRLIELSQIVNA